VDGAMQQHLCFLVSGQDVDPSTFLHQGDAQSVGMRMLIHVSQMPRDQLVWLTYPILVTHPANPIRANQLSRQVKAYGETHKPNNQRRPPELMSSHGMTTL